MQIKTVLFDIGGVLTPDPYETILLHKTHGLGLSLNLSRSDLSKKLSKIWSKYATTNHTKETNFWDEVSTELGLKLSTEDIDNVQSRVITANPEAIASFKVLKDMGIKLGIISNNTSFFYLLQSMLIPFVEYMEMDFIFLSHERGCRKSDGLFELATEALDPKSTFVIDDRPINIEYAKRLGFDGEVYSMENGDSLLSLVQQITAR